MNIKLFFGGFWTLANQNGSIIVVVLLVTVAVLMAATSTMSVLTQGSIAQNTSQTESELSYLEGNIASILISEVSCRAALGGPVNYGKPPYRSAQTYDPTVSSNPIVIFQADGVTPMFRGAVNPASLLPFEAFGHPQTVIRSIALKPIRVIDAASRTYWAKLEVTAFKPSGLLGASVIKKDDLRLSVQIDAANNIMSCSGLTFSGGGTLQPLPVCAPGQALYSDGSVISCVKAICPTGSISTGYQVSGDICCKAGGVGPCL